MFKLRTVFVLGAGASAEMGFPTGRELTGLIAHKLSPTNDNVSDPFLHRTLLDYVNQTPPGESRGGLSDYLAAAGHTPSASSLRQVFDNTLRRESCMSLTIKAGKGRTKVGEENMRAYSLPICAAVFAGLLAVTAPAYAVTSTIITIDDATEDFEAGSLTNFTATGSFTGVNVGFIILDQDGQTISDLMTVQVTPNVGVATSLVSLNFLSDTEGGPPLNPTTFFPAGLGTEDIIETGNFQVVYSNTDANANSLTIQFRSDVEAVPVPEPASLMLLGTALVGFGVMRRRRRRVS